MAEVTHFADFGMDTLSLAGPLAGRLAAVRAAGFQRVMLDAGDLAAHPGGVEAAVREVRGSGLTVTGLRALQGFEGLGGPAHDYKVDIARALISLCAAVGGGLLLTTSSSDPHASGDAAHIARDLRKLATMAVPLGIRIAYEGVPWARHVAGLAAAAEVVARVDCPNFGLVIDSNHSFDDRAVPQAQGARNATDAENAEGALAMQDALETLDLDRVFVVQLADFLWRGALPSAEQMAADEHFRVFPGQGAHGEALQRLVLMLDRLGYRGPYSLAVANRDYRQLPPAAVAAQARRAAVWLAEDVLHRAVPLPHQLLQRRGAGNAG